MQFQNHIRNQYGKCDLPDKTLARIRQGFERLDLRIEYAPFKVSENLHWGRAWIDSIKLICEGKGVTPELAEASAYAEMTERFSAGLFYPVFEEQVRFNMPALYNAETTSFLNFEWMKGYVHAHQDEFEDPLRIEDLLINETHLSKADIEEIKNSDMAKHWVDGFSITRKKAIKVPINFIAYIHGSNGMAAGNTIEEAMIQATCEIFERYVQIRIIRPEKEVSTIDQNSVENPLIHDMIRFYERQGIRVRIKDLSLDQGLPVIGVLYVNQNLASDRLEHRLLVPGSSFNLEDGLMRCFTEGAQGRSTLKRPRPAFDKPVRPESEVDDHYMLMRCGVAMKDISFLENGDIKSFENRKCPDLYAEINEIEQVCRDVGTECIILNFTHPVIDFPVVRIVIPGMSDFLPFLRRDVLVSEKTRPSTADCGREFIEVMKSFFIEKNPDAFA